MEKQAGKARKVQFYQTVMMGGITTLDIPDEVPDERIAAYVEDHINDAPLPQHLEYIEDSDILDEDSITVI